MRIGTVAIGSIVTAILAAVLGYVSWRFVALADWSPAFPSLLTALSLMAGAVLVRLARNAPITSPSTFDEKDLERFFSSLESLSQRLFWIFAQSMIAIFFIISAIVIDSIRAELTVMTMYIKPAISGLLAAILVWLVWRLLLMARGDIGFLRLQRQILENALKRDRVRETDRILKQPVILKSVGEHGRQL